MTRTATKAQVFPEVGDWFAYWMRWQGAIWMLPLVLSARAQRQVDPKVEAEDPEWDAAENLPV